MKARITKLVSLFAMTAMFLFSNIAAQVTSAIGVENVCSIEDCAYNIKCIYKEQYPESEAMINDIVDTIVSDDMFVSIFKEEGASAFEIVEDSLNDALNPEPMPLIMTDDLYTSEYSFPVVKQMNSYFCGPAATLMALIGSGASNFYYTNDQTILNAWQTQLSQKGMLDTTKNGTIIYNVTNVMNNYIPSVNGYTYKSKVFTRHSYSQALGYISASLLYDAVPIINISNTELLNYYKGNSFIHYMVVNYVDFNAETVMLYDPHYDSRFYGNHTVSFEEFEKLAIECENNLWVSVYSKD